MCDDLDYRNRNNGRVRGVKTQIRKGYKCPAPRRMKEFVVNPTSLVRAFMCDYIWNHTQKLPSVTEIYVDHVGNRDLYKKYLNEAKEKKYDHIEESSFENVWRELMKVGVTNPETSTQCTVKVRVRHAKGFSDCNCCSYYKMRMRGTSDVSLRQAYQRKLQNHIQDVYDDREELERIQRLCIVKPNHYCGFFLDAAESNKFSIPTTTSTAKQLSQL